MSIEKNVRAGIELRALDASGDAAGKMTIEGKAIAFNSPTMLFRSAAGIEYFEQIDAGALEKVDMRDTCLRYNHDRGVPVLARTRGGSLQTEIREDGLYFRAELFDTTAGRDCYELVRQGALQCSFGFTTPPDGGDIYDRSAHTRTILRIDRLIDLSVVDTPAYKDTFVQARDFFSLESERERLESRKRRAREIMARTI